MVNYTKTRQLLHHNRQKLPDRIMKISLENLRFMFLHDHLIKNIIRNSSIILFGNTMASAINLVSFTIMANKLGPAYLALLVLAQTYTSILNDIFNVQTWESMVRYGADISDKQGVANVIKINTILDGASALVAFSFAVLLVRPIVNMLDWDKSLVTVISFYSLSILFRLTSLTIGIPRVFNKFSTLARIQVAMAVIKFAGILYVIYFASEFVYYAIVYLGIDVLTNAIIIVFSLILLRQHLDKGWWRNAMALDRNQLIFIWWTNLRTILRIPVRYFDMIVISTVMPLKTVGIYKVYKEISGIMDRFSDPINQAIFPEFSKLIGTNDIRKSVTTAKKSILLLAGASGVMTLCLLMVSKLLIARFFGIEYVSHMPALYILIMLTGISFVLVPINSLFVAAGFARVGFYIVLLTNIIYLLTIYSLGKMIGIYGVVVAYGVQMFLNQGLKLYLMQKHPTGWNTVIR
jgi:O-antigen/teichoic acid export membrane protein